MPWISTERRERWLRRRDFIASPLTLAGVSEERVTRPVSLASRYLKATYDLEGGTASLYYQRGGAPLLLNATAAAVFPRGEVLASDTNYERTARTGFADAPGIEGEHLAITCRDKRSQIDLQCRLTLLRDRPGAVFELVATNVSGRDIVLRRTEPLRALLDENAGCYFGARQALTHGYMHHDPGALLELGRPFREFTSHWNATLYRHPATLILGHLDNTDAEGQIWGEGQMTRGGPTAQVGLGLAARSQYGRHFVLRPGAAVSSGRVMLLSAEEPFGALEYYAGTCGRLAGVKLNPIINGWCAWFYTHLTATEGEQLRNARFIARHLKAVRHGVGADRRWLATSFGDWEANQLYPHGMNGWRHRSVNSACARASGSRRT